MEIQSVSTSNYIYVDETKNSTSSQNSSEVQGMPQRPPDDFLISGLGQILESLKEDGTVSKDEVKSFMDSLMEQLKSGSFDATELAENAPDWLKEAADKLGIDLEDALTEFAENAPPAPPSNGKIQYS